MSYGSNDTFGVFLAHSVQRLWSLIRLTAGAGVKGLSQQQKFFEPSLEIQSLILINKSTFSIFR